MPQGLVRLRIIITSPHSSFKTLTIKNKMAMMAMWLTSNRKILTRISSSSETKWWIVTPTVHWRSIGSHSISILRFHWRKISKKLTWLRFPILHLTRCSYGMSIKTNNIVIGEVTSVHQWKTFLKGFHRWSVPILCWTIDLLRIKMEVEISHNLKHLNIHNRLNTKLLNTLPTAAWFL